MDFKNFFLLWLYANEQQMRAAKIATFSLSFYILSALALITPMGASGLALAGTIGGFAGFILTIKAFGTKEFFNILLSKNAIYLAVGSILLTIALLLLKDFIAAYI